MVNKVYDPPRKKPAYSVLWCGVVKAHCEERVRQMLAAGLRELHAAIFVPYLAAFQQQGHLEVFKSVNPTISFAQPCSLGGSRLIPD